MKTHILLRLGLIDPSIAAVEAGIVGTDTAQTLGHIARRDTVGQSFSGRLDLTVCHLSFAASFTTKLAGDF